MGWFLPAAIVASAIINAATSKKGNKSGQTTRRKYHEFTASVDGKDYKFIDPRVVLEETTSGSQAPAASTGNQILSGVADAAITAGLMQKYGNFGSTSNGTPKNTPRVYDDRFT